MSERKKITTPPPEMSVGEALERFMQAKPEELAESLSADVLKGQERIRKRIRDARREIEDGARPKKGRFRL